MQISILGCGWLGLPLGAQLKTVGHSIKGSTTRKEKISLLEEKGISPFLIDLGDEHTTTDAAKMGFFDCDILIISVPPRSKTMPPDYHPQQIKQVLSHIKPTEAPNIIYISATSVYPKNTDVANETYPINAASTGNKALYEAEQLLLGSGYPLNILRCGGLMGYDRIPAKYFEGKTVANGANPVNYIHRDDVIGIIETLIAKNTWGNTYNLVAPMHPSRIEVFKKNVQDFNFVPPNFSVEPIPTICRLILGEKVIKTLQYDFLFPDPLEFYYTLPE